MSDKTLSDSDIYLTEKIIKKDLHVEHVSELIPCTGYQYLSIFTDGAFNPDPTYLDRLNHWFVLKDSNRIIPIYGEMRNILIKGNSEIRYTNLNRTAAVGDTVQNGYGNIIFYLSNYPNDFMTIKGNIGFQWEDSFTVAMGEHKYYHFGINRIAAGHILAAPFIANCFNKLIYLYKESALTQAKEICYCYEDSETNCIELAVDTLTELLLPTKRFYLHFQANATGDSDFDIMLKFMKS